MLSIAFKEWAVICRALAEGRQSLILRKGGVAEEGGTFRPEHPRFWLYPSFFHEHRSGVRPELLPLLDAAEADRPGPALVRLSHFAEVTDVTFVGDLAAALRLAPLHGWTDDVVRQRFHYRTTGLYVLTVRVFRVPMVVDVPERPEYAGCKTWVAFDHAVPTAEAVPVMPAAAFAEYARRVADALAG